MAKATRPLRGSHDRRDEERYVAKMNFRNEKVLKNQIERLNKEKLVQVKSLTAQMRTYEKKLQKINDRIEEVEQLSRSVDSSQRLPTREYMTRLTGDVARQRHLATGVGYSYIDQLLGVSKPLVHRPLRWGLNPSLPSLQQPEQISKPVTLVTNTASKTFITEIKGDPIYLRPREAAYVKKQKPKTLVLPPLPAKSGVEDPLRQSSLPTSHKRDILEENTTLDASKEEQSKHLDQEAAPQLPTIPEGEIESMPLSPEAEKKDVDDAKIRVEKEQLVHVEDKDRLEPSYSSHIGPQPDIQVVVEGIEPVSEKEMLSSTSSSLRGHFITEFEFPSYQGGGKQFTRSSEMLNAETSAAEEAKLHNENKPNSFRYRLHARRFSL